MTSAALQGTRIDLKRFWSVRAISIVAGVAGVFLIQRVALTQNDYIIRLFVLAGLFVSLAVSLNLINGITGQFSIGHAAFYQIGAYTAGLLSRAFLARLNLPPYVCIVAAMFAGAITASLAGFVVGLPSLRLKGDYLAIVTLGFGEIIRIVVQDQDSIGGAYGMHVALLPKPIVLLAVWGLAFLSIVICRNLLQTAHGLPFLAVRDDEIAGTAMGVNVTAVKVVAFMIGSAIAGMAGAALAYNEGFIAPQMFTMDVSFMIVTMVVFGGTGSITGSALAAAVLFYIPEKMRDMSNVSLGGVTAFALCVGLAVYVVRHIMQTHYDSVRQKLVRYVAGLISAVTLWFILSKALDLSPVFQKTIEGERLRMPVFAGTLIVLMLIRPQGVLGHYEFSWSFVRRIFGPILPPNLRQNSSGHEPN